MAETEDKIPTLTNIVQAGNEDMFHHFDAHQFNIEAEPPTEPQISLHHSAELSSDGEHMIPSITLDNNPRANDTGAINPGTNDRPSIPLGEDFSDAMSALENNLSPADIKDKIDQAISESLTEIEAYLKNSLYKKFDLEYQTDPEQSKD